MKKQYLLILFIVGSFLSTLEAQTIRYVKENGTGDRTGTSWADASGDIQAIINASVSATKDEVWVAKGTYRPNRPANNLTVIDADNRDNAFVLKADIQLYGGFAGTETTLAQRDLSNAANKTILSGDLGTKNVVSGGSVTTINNADNAYHVVISAGAVGTAILDGFTVSNGNANGPSAGGLITVNGIFVRKDSGGGMNNSSSSPTISNTTFNGNAAGFAGGGMNNVDSFPTISNTTFSGNTSSNVGGGMYNASPSSSSPTISNSTFSGNTAVSNGGGMFNDSSSPTISNTIFSGNTATNNGGGMYNIGSSSPTISNTTFSGNTATNNGGGMFNTASSSPTISNTIILGTIQGNSSPTFKSSITATNTYDNTGSVTTITTKATDLFNSPTNGDYTLKIGSVAINAGNNILYTNAGGSIATDKDLAGNPRVFQNTIDIGAYESQTPILTPDANNIVYVNKTATGNGSGDSWANATKEVAYALLWANTNKANFTTVAPLKIYVAKGTYYPLYSPEDGANFGTDQNRENAFLMVSNVQMYGGFLGTEALLGDRDLSNAANKTILSGDLGIKNVVSGGSVTTINNTDNSYHVVVIAGEVGTSRLDGFTVSDGNANDTGSVTVNTKSINQSNGGGVINSSSSSSSYPIISNITFSENTASNSGGGMFNSLYSSPIIRNTSFIGNNAVNGGGMYNSSDSSPTINNTTFRGNTASGYGGGMANNYCSSTISNTVFSGNTATTNGGGVFNQYSSLTISNNTITGNTAANGGGMCQVFGSLIISNTILLGNTADTDAGIYDNSSSPVIKNSIIQGSVDITNGNINTTGLTIAELFKAASTNDFSLKVGSIAINAGSNILYTNAGGSIATDKDLAGNPRLSEVTIDIGAYELKETPVFTFENVSKTYGDANFDLAATSTSSATVTYSVVGGGAGEVMLSGKNITIVKAGTVTLKASVAETANYLAAEETITVTIAKAELTATSDNKSRVYGIANPAFTLSYTGFKNSDNATDLTTIPTTSTTASLTSDVGDYPIEINITSANATNYTFVAGTNGTLAITKAELTVTSDNKSRVYGIANPAFTLSYTGFKNSDDATDLTTVPTASTTASLTSDVGDYPIEINITSANATNYTFVAGTKGTLAITKANQIITFGTLESKIFGDASFNVSATTASNLAIEYTSSDETVATISGNTVTVVGAGTATITATQVGNTNYNEASTAQSLEVLKASQTITFNALNHTNDVFELTATSTSGLVITYTSSDENVATISGNTVTVLTAGTTIITANQAGNTNYEAAEAVAQELSINALGINENQLLLNSVRLYPNPSSNFMKLETEHLENVSLKIYNVLGKLVLEQKQYISNEALDISNLSNGIYMVKISNTHLEVRKKFLKVD